MKTAEIRKAYLEFFKSKGHTHVESSSLIPSGDPTLLFANSGMVQFKDCFLGTDKRAYTRATTCQKSLRISGKHNDLSNVGRTARHHTFFEMLGNFSFGDYFKPDAIKFAWEFVTGVLAIPKNRLWVTVYEEDEEARQLWSTLTDIQPERILSCGKDDNFWAMGDTGPCGPCSEIYYYLGDNVEGQSEAEFRASDGLYFEIWNLVFMQFNRSPKGELSPLPKPSVDTGMGLERIAVVKQGVQANYDIDLLRGIIAFTEKLCGKTYDGRDYTARDPEADPQYARDVAFRVIADHSRAVSFLIADGVMPSSDGRGYVLRRLIRRACRHARVLGFREPFLNQVCRYVIEAMGEAYPELNTAAEKICKIVKIEEEKFLETLDQGLSILNEELTQLKKSSAQILPAATAFLLHDTYGFPLDMTEDLAKAQGIAIDFEGFQSLMEEQRERSRQARAGESDLLLRRAVKALPTSFVGYEFSEYESTVIGLFNKEGELKSAREGEEVVVITAETPFYAESGGQLGDTGSITANGLLLDVIDTQKVAGDTIAHVCRVMEGEIESGLRVRLAFDTARRERLRVHHSATHLLHYALRKVLGKHVKQAGSKVSDKSLRFDFSHFEPITPAQLRDIEVLVNEQVQLNHAVSTRVMGIEEAKRLGATALFGEKYGQEVRVVEIGPESLELCGGTHARRSGDLGLVQILAEASVAAGVRRIEAVAGMQALRTVQSAQQILSSLSQLLKVQPDEFQEKIQKLLSDQKSLEKEAQKTEQRRKAEKSSDLLAKVSTLANGIKVLASEVEEANPKQLREIADELRSRMGSGCLALASVNEGKVLMLLAVTEDLVNRYHAGKMLQELAQILGCKGGGKPDLAQAGGGKPEKLSEALSRFQQLVA